MDLTSGNKNNVSFLKADAMKGGRYRKEALRRKKEKEAKKNEQEQEQSLRETLPEAFVTAVVDNSTPLGRNDELSSSSEQEDYSDESDDEFMCKKCQKQNMSAEEKDVTLNNVTPAVFTVSHQLRKGRERRKGLLEQEKIKEIMIRVNEALEHAGEEHKIELPETNDTFFDADKSKRKERKKITDKFALSEQLSKSRNDIILDIDSWLHYLQEDLTKICELELKTDGSLSDEEFQVMNCTLLKSNEMITRIAKIFQKKSKNKKPKPINESKTKPEKEKEEVQKQDPETQTSNESLNQEEKYLKVPKKIYTEKEFNNIKNLKQSIKIVASVLEDGAKYSSSIQAKSNFKTVLKQFKVIGTVFERKLEYISELDEKNKQLASEVTNTKFLEQQKKTDAAQIKDLKDENIDLKDQIEDLKRNVDELSKQPSMMSYKSNSRHTERRVSIQLPYEQEASVEIFVAGDEEIRSVISVPDNLKREVSTRRSMVSRSYLQSSITTDRSHLNANVQTPKASTLVSVVKPPPPPQQLTDNTDSISSLQETYIDQDNKDFELDSLRQQLQYFKGMFKNTELTMVEQQKEIERLSYVNTERKPSTLTSTLATPVKSSRSMVRGNDKKYEQLEHQLKKAKKDIDIKQHEIREERRVTEQLRTEIQKLLHEKEKLGRKIYKESTDKFETADMSREQLLKKLRNESEKEVQRLRTYTLNEQHRYQANLRRIHAEHRNYISSLKGENVRIVRALNRFKHVVMQLLQEDDIKELETIDEVSQEEKLRLYEEGKDSITLNDTALEVIILLEKSLQKVMLEKRLMLKHAQSRQQTVEQELDKHKVRLESTTMAYIDQEHLVKRANDRNDLITKQYNDLVVTNNTLQKEISPCRDLLNKYNCLQREVERLNTEERTNEKETKGIIKEFEDDRNRLKKELNRMNLAQICQLHMSQNISMQGKTFNQKIEIIDRAYEMNKINSQDHEIATEVIEMKNDITNQQFVGLIERYMLFKKTQTLNEYMLKLGETYKDEKRFQKYYELCKQREVEIAEKWEERKNIYRAKREEALQLLMNILENKNISDTSLTSISLLSRPQLQEAKKVYNRKMMARKKSIPKFPSTVSDVVGTRLTGNKIAGSYWQMPPSVPPHLVQINTPRLLEMDVNEWRRTSTTIRRKNVKQRLLFPSVATVFDPQEST